MTTRYFNRDDVLKTLKHLLYETAMNQSDIDIIENRLETWVDLIPTVDVPESNVEKLTDEEQRIFLAAMGREVLHCRSVEELWDRLSLSSDDDIDLVKVCEEVERKVKNTLWT